jgi:hypothetical protein
MFLDRYTAKPGQYVLVEKKNGQVEHIHGPAMMFKNPVLHEHMSVLDGISLESSSDCVIVCKPDKIGEMIRHVVRGPMLYIPSVGESILTLEWTIISTTATSSSNGGKANPKEKFHVISTTQKRTTVYTQFMTKDAMRAGMDINFGFRIVNVDKAIDIQDPMVALKSAIQSDLLEFGQMFTAAELFKDPTEQVFAAIQDFEFKTLKKAANRYGFEVTDVTKETLHMPSQMRKEEDQRISSETQHKMELRRQEQVNTIAKLEIATSTEMEQQKHELQTKRQQNQLQLQEKARQAHMEEARERNAVLVDFLSNIHDLGVDLTKYLTNSESKPGVQQTQDILATLHIPQKANVNASEDETGKSIKYQLSEGANTKYGFSSGEV